MHRLIKGVFFSSFIHYSEAPDLGHCRAGTFSHHHVYVLSRHTWRCCGIRCDQWRILCEYQTMAGGDWAQLRRREPRPRYESLPLFTYSCLVSYWWRRLEVPCVFSPAVPWNVSKRFKFHPVAFYLLHFVVGNKDDDPERKVVLTSDAKRIAEASGMPFFETSAKENRNVEEVGTKVSIFVSLWAVF